jgi:hypothetical protein
MTEETPQREPSATASARTRISSFVEASEPFPVFQETLSGDEREHPLAVRENQTVWNALALASVPSVQRALGLTNPLYRSDIYPPVMTNFGGPRYDRVFRYPVVGARRSLAVSADVVPLSHSAHMQGWKHWSGEDIVPTMDLFVNAGFLRLSPHAQTYGLATSIAGAAYQEESIGRMGSTAVEVSLLACMGGTLVMGPLALFQLIKTRRLSPATTKWGKRLGAGWLFDMGWYTHIQRTGEAHIEELAEIHGDVVPHAQGALEFHKSQVDGVATLALRHPRSLGWVDHLWCFLGGGRSTASRIRYFESKLSGLSAPSDAAAPL